MLCVTQHDLHALRVAQRLQHGRVKSDLHRITLVQPGADNAQHDFDCFVECHAVQRLVECVLLGLRLRQALRNGVGIDGRGVAAAFDVGHALCLM